MGIPPQAARILAAWPDQNARPKPQTSRERTHGLTLARILHPLHRPIPSVRVESQSPVTAKPVRHA